MSRGELYAEIIKTVMTQMPHIGKNWTISTETIKVNLSKNKFFCDDLAMSFFRE